jgi:hypothetical protein
MPVTIHEALSGLCGKDRFVRITRRFCANPSHHGFIIGIGARMVLVQQFHDFYQEGVAALRIGDITSVARTRRDALFETILLKERLFERSDLALDLDDWCLMLGCLHRRRRICVVECESQESSVDDLYIIGRIVAVRDDAVVMRGFSPLGFWHRTLDTLGYERITQVQIETPYINMMAKYVRSTRRRRPS